MIKVIEINGRDIPGNIYGVAYKFGERLNRPAGYVEYGGATITAKRTGDNILVLVEVSPAVFIFNNKSHPELSILEYSEDEQWVSDLSGAYSTTYGNTDWKGPDGAVLCWKGVSSRHFEVDATVGIAGYMAFDEEVEGPPPITYYTPFGRNIYAGGDILDSVPDGGYTSAKVLGCAYLTHETKAFLIAVVGKNYRSMGNPEGSTGGFFNEVYVKNGTWQRINYERGSRPIANWFFNQSGSEAQCVTYGAVKKVVVTVELVDEEYQFTATFSSRPACTGNTTESVANTIEKEYGVGLTFPPQIGALGYAGGNPADYTVKHGDRINGARTSGRITASEAQDCVVAVDYIGDAEVVGRAVYSLSDRSEYKSDNYSIVGWLTPYNYEPQEDKTMGEIYDDIGAGNDYAGRTHYFVTGGCEPLVWTFPADDACGTQTIRVEDNAGQVRTKQVKMNNGHWVVVSDNTYTGTYSYTSVDDTGLTRVTEQGHWSCSDQNSVNFPATCGSYFNQCVKNYSGGCSALSQCSSASCGSYPSPSLPVSPAATLALYNADKTACVAPAATDYILCDSTYPNCSGGQPTINHVNGPSFARFCHIVSRRIVEEWQCA